MGSFPDTYIDPQFYSMLKMTSFRDDIYDDWAPVSSSKSSCGKRYFYSNHFVRKGRVQLIRMN